MPEYTVEWEDVRKAAVAAFALWNDSADLEWAETAWATLTVSGLTGYSTEVERHRILVRFLVLPSFYRDWVFRVDREDYDDWYSYWAENLDLSAFSLGQLLGLDVEIEVETEVGKIDEALNHLVPAMRKEVVKALLEGLGEDDLFLSLWRIRHRAPDPAIPEEDLYLEDDYEVLNSVTSTKMVGWEWITEGCPENRWQREHISDEL
jgi:hypothetical protein